MDTVAELVDFVKNQTSARGAVQAESTVNHRIHRPSTPIPDGAAITAQPNAADVRAAWGGSGFTISKIDDDPQFALC